MIDSIQQENVRRLLETVNDEAIVYDPYEYGVPVHNEPFVKQVSKDILSDYAVVTQEEWDNVKHVFWVLLRTVENKVDPDKDIFSKGDVEAGYRLVKRVFGGSSDLNPQWWKGIQ